MNSFGLKKEDLTNTTCVIGLGGMGNNTLSTGVDELMDSGFTLLALNSDEQALSLCKAKYKLTIGSQVCKGLGCDRSIDFGEKAMRESLNEINEFCDIFDKVIIINGLGGGTSGGLPVLLECINKSGIESECLVSYPFQFEGEKTQDNALKVVEKLKPFSEQLHIFSNVDYINKYDGRITLNDTLKLAGHDIIKHILGQK